MPEETLERVVFSAPPASEAPKTADATDSLFDHFAWLYVFFREKIFRDDTTLIARNLWPAGKPEKETTLIELGCGPGFYARSLAAKFPETLVLGVDQCPSQLAWARRKATKSGLTNCRFARDNVLALSHPANAFDTLVASRLFTILPEREHAISEMHRVIKSGGRILVAEPRYAFWASIPLFAMWILAALRFKKIYREPSTAMVMKKSEFAQLFHTQPWARIKTWQEGRYQYALCEKK